MKYAKLVAIATAVTTIGGYTFAFSNFDSQDGAIKRAIDNLKNVALGYKSDLEKLQGEYSTLLGNLNSTQDALAQARLKLQAIYQKITGQEWDEATQGDILDFDFDTLLKDGEQFDNNVDGNAIAEILGLPAGATTEQIIAKIQELIATVQSLEQRIEVLEAQVTDLEAQIAEYETEQDSLVEEITGLKAKLDEATTQANAIIDGASQEEREQLDYVNDVLEEFGEERVESEQQLVLKEDMNAKWAIVENSGLTSDVLNVVKNEILDVAASGDNFSVKINGSYKSLTSEQATALNNYWNAKTAYENSLK